MSTSPPVRSFPPAASLAASMGSCIHQQHGGTPQRAATTKPSSSMVSSFTRRHPFSPRAT
jgi:hypothetical protein